MRWTEGFAVLLGAGIPLVALWLWSGWAMGVYGKGEPEWVDRQLRRFDR
jgi:hypothetical protein